MKNNCHICNSKTKFFMKKDGYDLYKCSYCTLVYMNPLPDQGFLNKDIYSFESGYQANKKENLSDTLENKKTKDILKYFEINKKGGRILDVGCSNGEFLYHAKQRGFETYGVELNKRTADIAIRNGINVYRGLLNDARFKDDFFDLIFLGDILEHVLSPRDFILECRRILSKDGIIVISTPNLDCLWSKVTFIFYRMFGIPWSSVTPPHHTFQFSVKNLHLLMKDLGFSSTTLWFYKPPRLMYELGSLHLLKNYKNKKNLKNIIFMLLSFTLYTIAYAIIIPTSFLRSNDFSMISIYTNKTKNDK